MKTSISEELIIEQRKRNIIYLRLILSFVLVLLAIYQYDIIINEKPYIIFYILIVIISNFIFISLPHNFYEGIKLHYIIFILDILFVALGAYWLTELNILFLIIIFLTIFISAISQSVKLSLLIAIVVNILYLYMALTILNADISELFEKSNMLLNIPFIFIVALHSSYLAEKANEDIEEKKHLKKANLLLTKKIKETNEEIDDIINFTARVYDSFREGIILINSQGIILGFNKVSESIFNISRHKVINLPYKYSKLPKELIVRIERIFLKKQQTIDEEIIFMLKNIEKRVILNITFVRDKTEEIIGILCTLKPVIDKISMDKGFQ